MSETWKTEKLKSYLTVIILVLTFFCILSSVVHNSLVTSWFDINFLVLADIDDYFKLGVEAFTQVLTLLGVIGLGICLIFWICTSVFSVLVGEPEQLPEKVRERNIRYKRYFALLFVFFTLLAFIWIKNIASNASSYLFDNKETTISGSKALAFIGLKHGISEINFGKDGKSKDCMIHIIVLANYRYFWSLRDKRVISYSEVYLNSVQEQFPPPNLGTKLVFEPPKRDLVTFHVDDWSSMIEKQCS